MSRLLIPVFPVAAGCLAILASHPAGATEVDEGALVGVSGESRQISEALETSEENWLRRGASVRFSSDNSPAEPGRFVVSGDIDSIEFAAMEDQERYRFAMETGGGELSLEEMAKKSSNPIGDVWMLWLQQDVTEFKGDLPGLDSEWVYTTTFQPVMSFPVRGGDWNLVVRPIFQYVSVPLDKDVGKLLSANQGAISADPNLGAIAGDPFGRTSGLGDTALFALLGPNREDGVVWGVGPTAIFPTADEDVLGQGKYQVGPAFLIAKLAAKSGGSFLDCTNFGMLAQHWWSVAGDDDRSHTSQTNIQYFINYRINATDMIGMTPNIRIDWTRDGFDDMVTIPIGLGYSTVKKVGKLPIRFVAEAQYSVIAPDDIGSGWNFRVMCIPIIANPFK